MNICIFSGILTSSNAGWVEIWGLVDYLSVGREIHLAASAGTNFIFASCCMPFRYWVILLTNFMEPSFISAFVLVFQSFKIQ